MQEAAHASARRQFGRNPVKANAFIHCGDRFQHAHIIDYSRGGLQLRGTFGLTKQDAIQVELISGQRISGKVAWSLGTQTGIVFSEPLSEAHPAILELARRARKALTEQPFSMASGPRAIH
jgi:PilZ domain-containing protein